MHLYITLPFNTLRLGLYIILEEAKHVLKYDLIFNLHAAPRFKTENIVDNPSNLRSYFYFLDDLRNNFQVVDR